MDHLRRRLAVGAVALALLVSGGLWVTHPDRFAPVGNEVALDGVVGQPVVLVEFAYPVEGSVHLRTASARVRAGGPEADVRVLYCEPSAGSGVLGSFRGPAMSVCSRTLEPFGQQLEKPGADKARGYLLVEVVPRAPGEIVVDGLDVSYRSGLRWGTESTGIVSRVRVSAA